MKSKKGQGLSMNTIIITIIVLVVLVVVVGFFTSGSGGLFAGITNIWQGEAAGESFKMAQQSCTSYCESGNDVAYCSHAFEVDKDGDGNADKATQGEYKGQKLQYYCTNKGQFIDEVPSLRKNLNIGCPTINCVLL